MWYDKHERVRALETCECFNRDNLEKLVGKWIALEAFMTFASVALTRIKVWLDGEIDLFFITSAVGLGFSFGIFRGFHLLSELITVDLGLFNCMYCK